MHRVTVAAAALLALGCTVDGGSRSYTHKILVQGGCAILAAVAVATGGLPADFAAEWRAHWRAGALRRLLGSADSRRLEPMFRQVTRAGSGDKGHICLGRVPETRDLHKHEVRNCQMPMTAHAYAAPPDVTMDNAKVVDASNSKAAGALCDHCLQVDEALRGTLSCIITRAANFPPEPASAATAEPDRQAAAAAAEANAAILIQAGLF